MTAASGVTSLDARLLTPVDGRIPAEAVLADVAGEPALVAIEGDVAPSPEAVRFLTAVPAITVAAPSFTMAAHCDGVADDIGPWATGFAGSPFACTAAALLLRSAPDDVWGGLVAESTTYSMLQAGPEFASWLARRGAPRTGAGDEGPRVRIEGSTIVLTRPQRRNALDRRMRDELWEALDTVTGPVTIRGEGPSFCAGGDLDEFGSLDGPVPAHLVRLARSLAWRLASRAAEVTFRIHGACVGSGIELPAFGGRVIAAPDTSIRLPEAELGLVPGAGGTVSMRKRIGRQRVLDLIVTGRTLDAATALAWGLVDEVG
jgi:hypothetical protein